VDTHIIFDLDGTLIDSKPEMVDTYRQVFLKIPTTSPIDFDSINFGATLPAILEKVYEKNSLLMTEARKEFIEIYDQSSYQNTPLYPSVKDVLSFLYKHDFKLHIATNKRLKPTLNILSKKEISSYFTSIKGSDMGDGKLLSKDEMVKQICTENNISTGYMIGDSTQDIEAGRASNLATVAVTYGYEKKEHLVKKKPTFVIDNLLELYNILKADI
jgi:phosphoglycolate phosphatase